MTSHLLGVLYGILLYYSVVPEEEVHSWWILW